MIMLDMNITDIRYFMKEWKCSNQLIREVTEMVPALQFRLKFEWDNWTLYQLGRELALSVEYLLYYFDREPNLAKIRLLLSIFADLFIEGFSFKGQ